MSSNLGLDFSEFNLRMGNPSERGIYDFDDFRLDAGHLMLYRRGEEIPLAPKAVETLLALLERRGEIVGKDELLDAVWPDTVVEESNLFLYLSILRKTLGTQKNGKPWVQTLRRRGYRFNGEVHLVPTDGNGTAQPLHLVTSHLDVTPVPTAVEPELRSWRVGRSVYAAAGLVAVVIALAIGFQYFFAKRPINSIAVMPFKNESGNPDFEDIPDSTTAYLIESLSKIPDLQVKAESTVIRYKGTDSDARIIGQELNVEAVLFGELIRRAEDLDLRIELVDSRNGNSLWRQTYPTKVENLVAIQSELARDLVRKLSINVSDTTKEKLAKRDTENSEARRLYYRGVFLTRKLTDQDIKKAIDLFWEAIHKDPSYARAYAALASAHRSLAMCCDGHPSELLKGKAAAQKAIELDDELAEGHSALGSILYSYDWNWTEAEKEFLRALELDPNSPMTHFLYADFLGRMTRRQEAKVHGDRNLELEPLSPYFNAFGAHRDKERSIERIRFAIDLDPNFYFSHLMAAGIYSRKEMHAEAIEEARLSKSLSPDQTWSDVTLSGVLLTAGRAQESRPILDQLLVRSKSRYVPPYHIAIISNYLGDKEQALDWLEKAYEIRDPKMTFLNTMNWKNVENDPRFEDIKRRVGLPERVQAASR